MLLPNVIPVGEHARIGTLARHRVNFVWDKPEPQHPYSIAPCHGGRRRASLGRPDDGVRTQGRVLRKVLRQPQSQKAPAVAIIGSEANKA